MLFFREPRTSHIKPVGSKNGLVQYAAPIFRPPSHDISYLSKFVCSLFFDQTVADLPVIGLPYHQFLLLFFHCWIFFSIFFCFHISHSLCQERLAAHWNCTDFPRKNKILAIRNISMFTKWIFEHIVIKFILIDSRFNQLT